MVQISKTLKKSLKPPASLQQLIETLLKLPENELASCIDGLNFIGKIGWIWQKTDMFHWIGVLNRFDEILNVKIKEYGLPLNQSKVLSPKDKYLLIQILIFTIALWDNSTNRSLYNSYEHLINLLGVCEPDVLYWTLRLMMKPALRLGAQKSLKAPYALAIPHLLVLAQKGPSHLINDPISSLTFSYYRTAKELKDLNGGGDSSASAAKTSTTYQTGESSDTKVGTATPSSEITKPALPATEATPFSSSSKPSAFVTIPIPALEATCSAVVASYTELKESFKVSIDHCRDLLHKIRWFNLKDNQEHASYFLAIRYIAIVILTQLLPEEQAELKIFMVDPELVGQACNVLIHPLELPHSLRFITCALIENVSHYRGKLTEVLGAINASANHGHIIQSIRKILDGSYGEGIEVQSADYNIEFIESLFNFVSYILSSSSGGNMLISAGLVPILSSALQTKSPLKTIAKCIVMLDMIQSETPTTNIDVNAVVDRIKQEVDMCLSLKSSFREEDLVFTSIPDPGNLPHYRELLGRTPLLRSMMKLILHLQQTNSTSDSMRRLIDSSLPATIKTIFNDSRLFSVGVGVFGLAVNIMSTFVHTEPTSLTILQEQGVVAAFLESSKLDLAPSPEVVSAFPNAFGAVCLNQSGLEAFVESNPIPKFLEIFTLKQHLPSLLDNDVPHLVGNSIDELIRHHPTTRDIIMKAVVDLVEKVGTITQDFGADPGCKLVIEGEQNDVDVGEVVAGTDIKLELDDNRASQYIDVLSRFIEGLFQNTAHCKEFMKFGGMKPLLRLYTLPSISYDFSTSSSSASVSYLFRTIVDVNGAEASSVIYESIATLAQEIDSSGLENASGDESIFLPMTRLTVSDVDAVKEKAQSLFRKLIILKCFLRLLNDVYCSNSLSHSKSIASLIDVFSPERAYSLLSFFARIARVCSLEWLILTSQVPEGWYKKPEKKDGERKDVEGADSAVGKNTKFICTLLEDIPMDISSFFRGILKTICHRRVLSEGSRKISQVMIDQLARDAMESLNWSRGIQSKHSFDFLSLALTHLRGLICEERGSGSLFQAYIAFSISQNSKFTPLLDLAIQLVDEKLPNLVVLKNGDEASKKEEAEKSINQLNAVVDIIADLCQCLVSDRYHQESPHTATLFARLKDSGALSFDPVAFLIQMRLEIFPSFVQLLLSPSLSNLTSYAINRVVGTMLLVLKRDGEQSSAATRAAPAPASGLPFSIAALSQQIFGGRPVSSGLPVSAAASATAPPRADPAKVDILADMGFPRPAAEIALSRCGNNVSRAADYLLTHPEVLSHVPEPAPAASTSSGPDAVPVSDNAEASAPATTTEEVAESSAAASGPSNPTDAIPRDAAPMEQETEESSNFVQEPPVDPEVTGKSTGGEDKGKDADNSAEIKEKNLADLSELRASKSSLVYDRVVSLLTELESVTLVFGLKELLCLDSMKIPSIAARIIASVVGYHDLLLSGVYESDAAALKRIQTSLYLHYHMLALIVSDSKTAKTIEIQRSVLSSDEFRSLSPLGLLSRVQDFQLWLSPLLLVLESYMSFCDEPTEVSLRADPVLFDKAPDVKAEKISMETRITLISDLIRIVSIQSLDTNSLHVLLRLIARLTLKWPVALSFVENGGFQALFKYEKYSAFPTHQSIIMIIARHCLEEPQLLQGLMKEELKKFLKHPRARSVDLAFLIKSCGHIIVRSTEDFVSAIGSVCKLNSYSATPSLRSIQISLQESALDEPAPSSSTDAPLSLITRESDPTKTPSGTPYKFSSNPKLEEMADVSKVVQFLTGQLISLKHKESSLSKYNTQCFLLQSLCELFVSFPKTKVDFIKSSMRKSFKQTPKANSSKNVILGYLLHEVVPVDLMLDDATVIAKDELDHHIESAWACRFLTALCYFREGYLDNPLPNELQAIRVFVIDALLKALKDAISQDEALAFEIRHGKTVSLANLCHDLLNPKLVVTPYEATRLEAHSLAVAKLMIEKGFVSVFISALAGLDINHPSCFKVVFSFLQPLDSLASAAIKIGKTVDTSLSISSTSKSGAKKIPSLFDNALQDLEDEGASHIGQTPHEISDMFRNSALGMLEPSLQDHHDDSEDSDVSDEEDEFDEFDEMDEEDMDDDMDEDSDADDDMEIVVPQPYHGGGLDEDDGESSSDDEIAVQDVSPGNPFLQEDDDDVDEGSGEDDIDGDLDLSEDEDDEEDDEDEGGDGHDPEDVDMFLGNHGQGEEDEDDEDDEANLRRMMDDAQDDGPDGIQGLPTAADLADIEDVFGQDNGNIFLEEPDEDDDDGDDEGPTGFMVPTQRAHRRMQQVFGMGGNNGIELQWLPAPPGGGRVGGGMAFGNNPFNRILNAANSSVTQDMTHPLLVNNEGNFVGTNPNSNRNAISSSRQMLNDPEDAGTIQLELLEQLLMNSRPQAMSRPPHGTLISSGSQRSLSQLPSSQPPLSDEEQQKLNLQGYALSFTEDRWKQDSKLQYGNYLIDKALRTGNAILNQLLPAAYQVKVKEDKEREEKKRIEEEKKKEEEEKKKEEEEKKKVEDMERTKADAEKIRYATYPQQDVEMAPASSIGELPSPAPVAPAPEVEERIIVMIDGNPVDITGSGIDVTFLEALPDELRLEVVNQHFRERELSQARDAIGPASELNPEFLDALPFEIREEVIRQERQENEQREAAARRAEARATAGANAISALLPGDSAAAAGVDETLDPALLSSSATGKSKSPLVAKESIQLVDSSNIASLLRLVFVPDPIMKDGIYKLLASLCQNSKSRSEIIGLLISVLNAGSTDLASVDKTFAQLTLKSSSVSSKLTSTKEESSVSSSIHESDFVPNLVAQRCLEALIHLTSSVSSVGKHFLTESEPVLSLLLKTPKSKKSKGKEKQQSLMVYPVIQLLNLLEQPSLLRSSVALEKLMHLLSNVLRPLSHIAKKNFAKPAPEILAVEPVVGTIAGSTSAPDHEAAKETVVKAEPAKAGSSSVKEKEAIKPDIKLPVLAEGSVCNVVKVLKDGSSSSKSFQFTLSVIQYLCSYPAHLNIVVQELLNSAQLLGDLLLTEIDLLLRELKSNIGRDSPDSLNAMILETFTSVGATQAKLLRILKTIDFLFSKTNDVALKYPYLTAMELFKTVKENAIPSEMEVLERLYDQLKFGKLWQKLSETMAIIDGRETLIHVGTVLLPFIEAFMVVSKPSVSIMKRLHHNAAASLSFVVVKQHSDISDNEPDAFILFAESNKRVLNTMVRNNPSLMNGSFALLVQNPKVLEFDNKRTYFTQQLHKGGRRNHQQIQINVRRRYVFEESYQQLQGRSGDAIKYGKLNVRFRDEEGVDAGGVTREWFSALALQMFNPDYALFRPSAADRVTYQPNRASEINPDHLFYFKFVGRIIGKAIYDGRLLDAHFTRSFYKCMISAPVDHKDMEAIDPEFYKSLDWILHNNITDVLDLNFSLEVDDFGRRKVIDLKSDGRNITVNETNKVEYVRLVTEQKLVVAIQDQIQAFLSGFHEIIPKDLIKIFNEQELELLISGLPDIDIDDWKNNTEYQNYTASSPQIQWFWRAVRSFSQEERAKLIQFATGTSKVPLGGFTQLQGSTGIQKFQIHKEFSSNARLPSAHTCFNQIDLPQYESYEQLRSSLLLAINESEGFGFA